MTDSARQWHVHELEVVRIGGGSGLKPVYIFIWFKDFADILFISFLAEEVMLFQAMKPLVKGTSVTPNTSVLDAYHTGTGPEIWEQTGGKLHAFVAAAGTGDTVADVSCFLKVRDYFHVMDLADDHVSALKKLFTKEDTGCFACNLGTVKGTSVIEWRLRLRKHLERRPGDATEVYASTDKAAVSLIKRQSLGLMRCATGQNPWGCQKPPPSNT
ncbi:bifunctional UDP-glucose 4-epimerase and UDP-xylose 4-epimerase 1 [Tanacetum coccineum]